MLFRYLAGLAHSYNCVVFNPLNDPLFSVVQFLGMGCESPKNFCLVSEHMADGDLLSLLRKERLPLATKIKIALGAAAG